MKFLQVKSERFDAIVNEHGLEPIALVNELGQWALGVRMTVNEGLLVTLIRA